MARDATAGFQAIKPAKNALSLDLRNSRAIVGDAYRNLRAAVGKADFNPRSWDRISDRIVEEVRKHFCDQVWVTPTSD